MTLSPICAAERADQKSTLGMRLLPHVERGCWIALAIAVCGKSIVEPTRHTVYPAFVRGARDWLAGNSLYGNPDFFYSPTFAAAFAPLAMLPDWLGGIIWNLLSILALVYALRVVSRDVLPANWPSWAPRAMSMLTCLASLRSIWSAQSNTLIIALVMLATAAIARRQWWRAAFLLAVPVHIKVWPAIAAALLGAVWPKKLAARTAVALVAFGMIPFLFKPPQVVADCYRAWQSCLAERQGEAVRWGGYRDAWTIWEQITPVDKSAYLAAQATAGLLVLGWCLWQSRKNRTPGQLATYTTGMWTVWQLLFGPGTERLTYNLAAPLLAWAVVASFVLKRGRAFSSAAFLITYVLGAGEVERLLVRFSPAAVAIQPLGIVVFAAWLAWHVRWAPCWETPAITTDTMIQKSQAAPKHAERKRASQAA